MGDRASAERACRECNPIIDGRKANVNLAILGAKPRGNVQAGKFNLINFENVIISKLDHLGPSVYTVHWKDERKNG